MHLFLRSCRCRWKVLWKYVFRYVQSQFKEIIFLVYESFIMYSRVVSIDTVHISDASVQDPPIKSIKNATYLRNAIGLAFSYDMQAVFYSDIQRGSINSVLFNGSNHAVIVESQ